MKATMARVLIALYPRAGRERYGAEFLLFLQDYPLTPFAVCDVITCAASQHLGAFGKAHMTNTHRSFLLVSYACAAAVAGGINFYWTVDDTPLCPSMHAHGWWLAAWNVVAIGSLLTLATAMIAALPIAWRLFRSACLARRRDIMLRLAFMPALAVLLLIWLVAVVALSDGHWLPTPWDIAGDWTAPTNWPPLAARWLLGSITLGLFGGVLIGGAISLKRAVELSENIGQPPVGNHVRFRKVAAAVLTGTTLMMTVAVFVWVLLAHQYEPDAFHAHLGGFMNSTTFASCIGSGVLFAAAALMAIRGTRWVDAADAN